MSNPVDGLSAAYAALAEIRRKVEAGKVKPTELEQTLALGQGRLSNKANP